MLANYPILPRAESGLDEGIFHNIFNGHVLYRHLTGVFLPILEIYHHQTTESIERQQCFSYSERVAET